MDMISKTFFITLLIYRDKQKLTNYELTAEISFSFADSLWIKRERERE